MDIDLNIALPDFDLNQYPNDYDPPQDVNHLPENPPQEVHALQVLFNPPQAVSPLHDNPPQVDHALQNTLPDLNQHPNSNLSSNTQGTNPQPQNINLPNKKKNLNSTMKTMIIQMLVQESQDGILRKGAISKVANRFFISTRSVSRIWHDTKIALANDSILDTSSKLVHRVGRKRVVVDLDAMKAIPFSRRTNVRSLASALGMTKSTVHRRIQDGSIRPHSNAVKPFLTDDNKKARLEFCLSMVDKGMTGSQACFINMYDRIHIDEKWFYMSKTSQKYYLHPDEVEPVRTCKSKRFIPKIMFLAAVARPRFDANANSEFDGKIGIWPFIFREPAKRSSKNRAAGTMETKPINSVTKEVIRKSLIEKLLPAIKEKWPCDGYNTIFIQQDNARPHIDANDAAFVEAFERHGLDIRLCSQPPNSPDLNVLDLGFFRAIDSLQHQEAPSTVDDFVASVEKAFDMFSSEDLNNVFVTLQSCMVEILKRFGGNIYKIPHMNKKKLIREGELPVCIELDPRVLDEAKEAVSRGQELGE